MSLKTPLEGLLRPPVEWISAFAFFLAAFLLFTHPNRFWISDNTAKLFAGLLMLPGCYRFYGGYKIWRYHRNLTCMRPYTTIISKLRFNHQKLFLGKGFLWTAQHTQRLRDLDIDYNLHYKYAGRRKSDVGGEACIHGVSDTEQDVMINLSERASHLLVLGLPGVGKTRFAELIISQDIHRGDVVIVLDPKGDIDLLKRIYSESKRAGREKDLMVFHLGFPDQSCFYNPIGNFTRVTEVANRISNQLPGSGDSQAFKEFGWQFINAIAIALVSMGEIPDYQKMRFYITKMDVLLERYLEFWLPQDNPNLEKWIKEYVRKKNQENKTITRLTALIRYVEKHDLINNPVFDDLYNACRYDREYFSKITASLGPLLKKLTTGKIAGLLSPDSFPDESKRPVINWFEVIRDKKIVYIGLDALSDPVVAAAVGNAMFSDLTSVAGRLYKTGFKDENNPAAKSQSLPRVCLHSDEFNEIIGDEFIPLLNKARGAGFTVTAYTQTWSDVEARLKSAAKAGQVAGNIGTVVMFRCKEAATVEMFLSQLPTVPVLRVVPASGSQDGSLGENGVSFRSNNEDRFAHSEQRLIEQNDVLNLPKGQTFCLLEGGRLYKVRMPMPEFEGRELPESVEEILQNVLAQHLSTVHGSPKDPGAVGKSVMEV